MLQTLDVSDVRLPAHAHRPGQAAEHAQRGLPAGFPHPGNGATRPALLGAVRAGKVVHGTRGLQVQVQLWAGTAPERGKLPPVRPGGSQRPTLLGKQLRQVEVFSGRRDNRW